MKNFYLFFSNVTQQHLYKDVFLVPFYLSKEEGFESCNLIFPSSENNISLPTVYRNVILIRLKNKLLSYNLSSTLIFIFYLLKNFKRIDKLMLFHLSKQTFIISILYKLLRPKGFLYIKVDGDFWIEESIATLNYKRELKKIFIKRLLIKCLKKVDKISVESKRSYNMILSHKYLNKLIKNKIILFPNCFDESEFRSLNVKINKWEEKDNLIITVGRLGSFQKNTEMFLESLIKVNLLNWKVVLIGNIESIEQDFSLYIENFFNKNPHLRKNVFFAGQINNRKELYEWYNRAKVFVLTSRYEGFCLSLVEAARFSNMILSTDVAGVKDIEDFSPVLYLKQNDSRDLADKLNGIINKGLSADLFTEKCKFDLFYETKIKTLSK